MFPTKAASTLVLILSASALASGVFLPAGQTPAKQKEATKSAPVMSRWPGEWLMEGNADQPCAIFQHGRMLLLVNERGEFATGRLTEAAKLIVL
jgi:hypothetical protein